MFIKDMNISYLLDFYGDILTERKRQVLDYYYNDDMSLAEIAEEIGISRQGVRELIKKSEDELTFYESKLGLAQRFSDVRLHAERALSMCDSLGVPGELSDEIKALTESVK